MGKYRDSGAIGALLDEYERAIDELKKVLNSVSSEELLAVVDSKTNDPDCKSIQTILSHIVRSGYGYAIEVKKLLNEQTDFRENILLDSISEYKKALTEMFNYNVQLFENNSKIKLEEFNNEKKIIVWWGQTYDVEQLFEHAIVHILRHRRQIERFLLKLR